METKIQTAANNAILQAVKSRMNGRIYKNFRNEWHFTGKEAAFTYLAQYFNAEAWPGVRAEIERARLS